MPDQRSPRMGIRILRPGGNARFFLDPLGWRIHRSAWPFIWLARKFRPGSRVNKWAYGMSDRIGWRRMQKAWKR